MPGLGTGEESNESQAWIKLFGATLQPAEFAKVTLACALAGYTLSNGAYIRHLSFRGLLPLVLVFSVALACEMVIRDAGTAVVMCVMVISIVSLAGKRAGVVYAVMSALALVVLVGVAYLLFERVRTRFDIWPNPYVDKDAGYQLIQGFKGLANGGLLGTGLGFGRFANRVSVPEVDNDLVYVAIVEELGIVGGVIVLGSFVALVRMLATAAASRPKGSFERSAITTVWVSLIVQAFIILGGVLCIIPLAGVTLPFVSRGGSSLIASLMMIGAALGSSASHKEFDERPVVAAVAVPTVAVCAAMSVFLVATLTHLGEFRLFGTTNREVHVGSVMTSDGMTLAEDEETEGVVRRSYPQGTFAAHVLGASSSGIESYLTKESVMESAGALSNALALPISQEDTVLTIDSTVQMAAERELRGETGAIVALDSHTGAILAMASSPSYNVSEGYDENAQDGTYVNSAAQATYAPGSTFKIITAATALEKGIADASTTLPGDTLKFSDGSSVVNMDNRQLGKLSMQDALTQSSNTAFGQLGLNIGGDSLYEQTISFGFEEKDATVLKAAPSTFVVASSEYGNAWASVGQPTSEADGSHVGPYVTVLKMAEVMGAIANDGVMAQHQIVLSGPLATANDESRAGTRVMSEENARELYRMLVESSHVEDSSIAGKTGTAELSNDKNMCWYVCGNRAAHVCVVVAIEAPRGHMGQDVAMNRALRVLDIAA